MCARRSDERREAEVQEERMRIMTKARGFLATATVVLIASLTLAAQQPDRPAAPTAPAQTTIVGCLLSGPNPSGVPDTVTYNVGADRNGPRVAQGRRRSEHP